MAIRDGGARRGGCETQTGLRSWVKDGRLCRVSAWKEMCDRPMFVPCGIEPAHEAREMNWGEF
jgi:hypothetical protein